MKDKGYLLRVIKNASFKKLFETVDVVHERSGKSKLGILLDMGWCILRYGAGYYDYQIFNFYELNAAQRKTYVTRFISTYRVFPLTFSGKPGLCILRNFNTVNCDVIYI